MKLLTKAIEKQLPPLYSQEDKGEEAIAYVKFFDPCSNWTWFATEYDPVEKRFFGLVIGHETEYGYFMLEELASFRNRLGLHIERDMWFKPASLKVINEKMQNKISV